MLKLFKANETNFDHNETILKDVVSAEVFEESNGEFSLTMEYPAKLNLEAGQIIEAPTPRGPQLFRIVKPTRVIGQRDYFRAYCRHIFYDLLDNFIEDTRPTNKAAGGALEDVLNGSQYVHRFTGTSDIATTNTAYYIRQNPVQAIMGSGNSVLGLWGGHIVRNNFEITIKEQSLDRGYEVRFGKNLIGLDEEIDVTEVVTRIYPTAVINEPIVTALPEKYIDSPLIGTYPEPIIRELRVELTDAEKELPVSEIYDIMRQKAQEQFTLGGDKPLVNYKVNFLHYTNDNAEILKQLDLNDTVRVVIDKYGINLSAKVIKYTYDSIKEKYLSMELGNFKESLANQRVEIGQIIDEINKTISDNNVSIADKMKAIGDMISGNNGGYKIDRFNDLGQPYETLYMDSPNLNTAVNVIRLNKSGIGFSTSGYNGPFNTAITIDGKIMGQYIVVNSLEAISANLGTITAGTLQNASGTLVFNLDTGEFVLEDGIARVDGDGAHFGKTGETVETGIGFDGVRINDGSTEIASFLGSGAVIKDLQAEKITGDVINIMSSSMTFDVGSGTGYYADFSEVLNAIGNRKHLANGVKITINIRGVLNESIRVGGFSGSGIIEVNIYNKINGYIRTYSNSCRVLIYGKNNTHVVSGSGSTIISDADSYTLFHGLNVDSKDTTSGIGIASQYGSNVYVENCDFVNARDAMYAGSSGKLQGYNNKGNPSRFAAMAASGRVWLRGTVPDGENYGFVYNFDTLTRTPSSFSPPATTTTNEILTFNHTDIYTYSVKYGARSTHYGKAAAQNRWDSTMTQMKGRISFGASVYNFISGRDNGTTPTVKMRLRRQNSTHGASASVAPTPEWSGAPSFGGATRGNWTPWVTIPYTLFASSGYTFSFYNGSTGNSYAIWDSAQIQITRTITQ